MENSNKLATIWISLIIILIFIFQISISGFTDSFVLNQKSFSQPYRFVAAIFLHGSFQHLLFNLFALVLFGLILESLIKSRNFLFVFFFSGILANLISVFFYNSALGASGAIFGIIGALTILKPNMTVWAFSLPMPLFLAAIFWALGDLLGVFFPSGVGNIAHLSGLFLGLIFGIFFKLRHEENKEVKEEKERIILPEDNMQEWENKFMR